MENDAAADRVVIAELVSDRRRPPEQWVALFAGGWPSFMGADEVAARCLPRVRELFGGLEAALTQLEPSGASGTDDPCAARPQMIAAAWGVPIAWDEDPERLPGGYSDALVRALGDARTAAPVDTLVVCAAQVRPDLRGSGLAARLLTHLIEVGADQGLLRVVVPLRPSTKSRYPLAAIEDYATWTRADDAAFDPWLRTHLRMGASVVSTVEASQTFSGTRERWEAWSGRPLPGDGRHVIDGALAPLEIIGDRGVLVEPGIWVRHR